MQVSGGLANCRTGVELWMNLHLRNGFSYCDTVDALHIRASMPPGCVVWSVQQPVCLSSSPMGLD